MGINIYRSVACRPEETKTLSERAEQSKYVSAAVYLNKDKILLNKDKILLNKNKMLLKKEHNYDGDYIYK